MTLLVVGISLMCFTGDIINNRPLSDVSEHITEYLSRLYGLLDRIVHL